MTKVQCIEVQTFLSGLGLYNGKIDGIAGPMTVGAIKLFQRANGLKDDGIVGPKTLAKMFPIGGDSHLNGAAPFFYIGNAKALEDGDLERVATDIGVEARAFRAIVAVEANGRPFDDRNRPMALYEPHVAYRMSSGDVRRKLVMEELAYAKWGTKKYPKSMDERYRQIERCGIIAGNELAADATSWGMGQIMGFNAQVCGYMNAVDMVRAFAADAENQLAAMGAFILNNASLYRALRRKDWEVVAELWNGAAYRKNNYHIKLASAYNEGG